MMKGVRDRRSGKTVVVSAPLEDDKKNEGVVVLRRNLIVGLLSLVLVLSLSGLGFAYTFATYSEKPFAGTEINVALVAEPRSDGLMKLLPEFEELTGIKVNLAILPYPNLQEQQAVALAQRTGAYDVVHVDCVWVGQYAGQGWTIPVEDFIAKTNPEVLAIDDFFPLVLEGQGMWEGQVFGLPFIQAVFGLYYRTDLFEKYGLEVPETWDELYEVVKFLDEKERDNGIHGFSFMGRRGVQLQCTWDNIIWSMGGDWYDENYRPTLDSPEAIAATEYLKSLIPFCPVGVLSYDWDENAAAFAQGKSAVTIQWQNAAPQFVNPETSRIVGNWNFAMVPGVRQEDGSVRRAPTFGGWSLMIPTDAPNKDAAWEFIVWATSPEMEKKLAYTGAGSRRSSLSDPELSAIYIEYEAMIPSLDVAKARPNIPPYSEMADAIEVALSEAMSGEKTAEQAMKEANQRLEMILRRAGFLR